MGHAGCQNIELELHSALSQLIDDERCAAADLVGLARTVPRVAVKKERDVDRREEPVSESVIRKITVTASVLAVGSVLTLAAWVGAVQASVSEVAVALSETESSLEGHLGQIEGRLGVMEDQLEILSSRSSPRPVQIGTILAGSWSARFRDGDSGQLTFRRLNGTTFEMTGECTDLNTGEKKKVSGTGEMIAGQLSVPYVIEREGAKPYNGDLVLTAISDSVVKGIYTSVAGHGTLTLSK